MIKVIWSEQARQELMQQYRYYYVRNQEAARRIRQRVLDSARLLAEHPRIGKPGRIEGTREFVISGTPFLIIYDENPVRVEILHLNNGRQSYPEQSED